ncbi:MAG: hypothetical protein OHK0019_02140 [Saprospiraceae bacterium]
MAATEVTFFKSKKCHFCLLEFKTASAQRLCGGGFIFAFEKNADVCGGMYRGMAFRAAEQKK